mmetsp:Transcript_36235/g.58179  ORF Transcript_36235/g.58179 Transcript_36235/m.58179 type:complete len:480 (-) Transcript_36235:178-1617(-)
MSGVEEAPNSAGGDADPSPEKLAIEFKEQGNDFLRKKNYEQAIEAYTKGISACENPEIRGRILGNRSQAYRRIGDMKEALNDANQAVKILPSYARGHLRKAYALRELKDWALCQEAIEYALGIGLDFKDNDEKNLKALLGKAIHYQETAKIQEKMKTIMEKLLGKWNGAVPAELGGGSQELDFKSESKVILTVPARQMEAKLKLDVSKAPMWLDITIPIPIAPGQFQDHMMPHLFEFNEDYTELHLMGPPDQGMQPGVPLRRPTFIDKESKSYVKMSRGAAKASNEEKDVMRVVEALKGKGDSDKMIKYCELLTKKLKDAVKSSGFKFEEPQQHWPEQEIKDKYTSMLKMSQYIFLLEKHFGQALCTNVSNIIKTGQVVSDATLSEAIAELRKIMIVTNMHKEEAPPAVPRATPATTSFGGSQGEKKSLPVKQASVAAPLPSSGLSALSLVLFGALGASAVLGIFYLLFGSSSSKQKKK